MDNKIASFLFLMLLMFTVSAARPAVDPPVTNPSAVSTDGASELTKKKQPSAGESVASTGVSNITLPVENVKSDLNETTANDQNPEPENKSTNDLTPRTNFSRFHPINRHFLSKAILESKQIDDTHRRTCRKHAQYRISRHRTGKSDRNQITAGRTDRPLPESFRGEVPSNRHRTGISDRNQITAGRTDRPLPESFRGEVPSNWLKMKHHYSSRGQQNNRRNKNDDGVKTKNLFDREKLKSMIRQHNEKKKKEEEARLNLNMNSNLMKSIRKFLKHTFD